MKSIQNQYIDLKEGKMSQTQFMRNVRLTMPHFITNVTSFNDTVKILKNKAILTEAEHINWETISKDNAENLKDHYERTGRLPYGLTPEKYDEIMKKFGLFKSLKEVEDIEIVDSKPITVKSELKKGIKVEMEHTNDPKTAAKIALDHLKENPKYYSDLENSGVDTSSGFKSTTFNDVTSNRDEYHRDGFSSMGFFEEGTEEQINEAKDSNIKDRYKGFKEIDKLNAQEVLIGLDWEMENDHSLTREKATKLVIKKLNKDPFYYTHWDLAGKEDMDVQTADGIKPEVRKMKPYTDKTKTDKGMAMKPVKGIEKIKASANKAKKETNSGVKGVKELTHVAKRAKGIKGVMAPTGGKMKKIKEGLLNEAGEYTFDGILAKDEIEKLTAILNYNKDKNFVLDLDTETVNNKTTVRHPMYNSKALEHAVKQVKGEIKSQSSVNPFGKSTASLEEILKDKIKSIIQEITNETFDGRDDLNAHNTDPNELFEVDMSNLQPGQEFTLSDDLGNFKRGERVVVESIKEEDEDVKVTFINETGVKDNFYFDPSDFNI